MKGMPVCKMSVSLEGIQSDLERLKIALEKINDNGLTNNSRVHEMRKIYFSYKIRNLFLLSASIVEVRKIERKFPKY